MPRLKSTADAVVANCDAQDGVFGVRFDCDRDRRGVRVLGRVGERLGDDIVGRDLDRLRRPARCAQVDFDRDGGAARERVQRRPQPAFGQDRRVDSTGELAQIIQGAVQSGCDGVQLSGQTWWHGLLRGAELKRE